MAEQKKQKSVLFVLNHIKWFYTHRLPVALEAKERGWTVYVAATGAKEDTRLKQLGMNGIEIPSQDGGINPFKELLILFKLRGIFKSLKPDLIHSIYLKYVLNAGLAARTLPQTKILFTIPGLGFLFDQESRLAFVLRLIVFPFLWFAMAKKDSHVIVQNDDDANALVGAGLLNDDKLTVIKSSGVDLAQFSYAEEDSSQKPIIFMGCRLLKEKGVIEYCEAARQIRSENSDVTFQLAGGFDQKNPNALKQEDIQSYIDDGSIEFLGHINDMPERMKRAAIIALPSYYREGVPKVLLEASAIGRPIITTDYIGCREAIVDGKNGLMIPVKDSGALKDAIHLLLSDPDLRKQMGAYGRKRIEGDFSSTVIAQRTVDLYKAI